VAVRDGDFADRRLDLFERLARTDEFVEPVLPRQFAAQRLVFDKQLAIAEQLLQFVVQIVEQDGLDEVIVGPGFEGLDGVFDRGVGGDDQHEQLGVHLLEPLEELNAVAVRQPHVADGDREIALANEVQSVGGGGSLGNDKTLADEKLAERIADDLFVFDDQHMAGILHDHETSVETRGGWGTSGCCRTLSHVKNTVNFVPALEVSDSSMRPSMVCSMICLQTNSPSPVPVSLVVK